MVRLLDCYHTIVNSRLSRPISGVLLMTYAYEAIFLLFILSIAIYHAKRFAKNISTGKWFHFLWALFFGFIILVMWWLNGKNWLLAGSLVLERFVFFNPI